MTCKSIILAISSVVLWSIGTLTIPNITKEAGPFWTAVIRFLPPLPFIYIFASQYNVKYSLTSKELKYIFALSCFFVLQIFLFHIGSVGSSGSRIAIFIFTFPVIVPFLAPLVVPNQKFDVKKIYGALFAFAGLLVAILTFSEAGLEGCLKNDAIELLSSILIAFVMVYVKRLTLFINVWKILIWQFIFASLFFLVFAILTEEVPDTTTFDACVWNSIIYQIVVVGTFCWISQQYLIAHYDPAIVATFFCIAPITSTLVEMIIGNSRPYSIFGILGIIFGTLLVGFGIFLSTTTKGLTKIVRVANN